MTGDSKETLAYRCFGGCGRTFESLGEMNAVAGRGGRSPRHFCDWCVGVSVEAEKRNEGW